VQLLQTEERLAENSSPWIAKEKTFADLLRLPHEDNSPKEKR
jgi:hypothetical protein